MTIILSYKKILIPFSGGGERLDMPALLTELIKKLKQNHNAIVQEFFL